MNLVRFMQIAIFIYALFFAFILINLNLPEIRFSLLPLSDSSAICWTHGV